MNKNRFNCLNEMFENEIEQGHLKGASFRVLYKDEIVFDQSYGTDKKDMIYRIFSMSKPITAVASMILVERGLLKLSDPVSKYLSGYQHQKVNRDGTEELVNRDMTVFDLLTMTSGLVYPNLENPAGKYVIKILKDHPELMMVENRQESDPTRTVEALNELGEGPLKFQPGSSWCYGLSADVLGSVVEVVSGMEFGRFLKKEIFDVLEMEDTGFYLPKEKAGRLAPQYNYNSHTGILSIANEAQLDNMGNFNGHYALGKPQLESGGGGLMSSMEDYTKFARMLYHKGTYQGRRILKAETVEYMTTNRLNEEQLQAFHEKPKRYGYGYGTLMRVMMHPENNDEASSVGEYGWSGKSGTYFLIDPKEEMILIYMQQIIQDRSSDIRKAFRKIVYDALRES